MNLLSNFLNNSDHFNSVLNHGCWCKKLDFIYQEAAHLGGALPVDDLDNICKKWFHSRACNEKYNGGSCHDANDDMMTYYTMQIGQDASNISNMKGLCETSDSSLFSPENYTACEYDTCLQDLHFAEQIRDFMVSNPSFNSAVINSNDYDTCVMPDYRSGDRVCTGTVPNLEITFVNRPP